MKFNEIKGEHDIYRIYNYNESILFGFRKNGVSIADMTRKGMDLPTIAMQKPEVMTYEMDAD